MQGKAKGLVVISSMAAVSAVIMGVYALRSTEENVAALALPTSAGSDAPEKQSKVGCGDVSRGDESFRPRLAAAAADSTPRFSEYKPHEKSPPSSAERVGCGQHESR